MINKNNDVGTKAEVAEKWCGIAACW
jgi:hypothetical protein